MSTEIRMEQAGALPPPQARPIPDRLRGLRRCVNLAWISVSLAGGLLWGQYLMRVLHPYAWAFVVTAIVAILSTLGVLLLGSWRVLAGPRRGAAVGLLIAGMMPAASVAGLIVAGAQQYRRGHIAPTVPFVLFAIAGSSLGEIEAANRYPSRMESPHLVMFYDDWVRDPRAELAEMERHVANLERMTRRPLRAKIHWVRGPLLGQHHLAIGGLALGSDATPVAAVDRHELAHAVIYQAMPPGLSPAMLLSEGWAEAQSRDAAALAERAIGMRELIRNLATQSEAQVKEILAGWQDAEGFGQLAGRARVVGPRSMSFLRELTSPFWFHRDRTINYAIGGAFADHVVRTYGADRFVALYLASRPGGFEGACQDVLRQPLDKVESDFWHDLERQTMRGLRPAR
ncbi:MAG: hypothetical protein JWN86_3072 [Planctomycetota bacterium]|nr:hypothetical protein [Planctomycetota bacterium]